MPVSVPVESSGITSTSMLPEERRSAASLTMNFALRMLRIFLVLPVFCKCQRSHLAEVGSIFADRVHAIDRAHHAERP